MLQGEQRAESDGSVSTESHLGLGREISHPPSGTCRSRKSGFGEADLGGYAAHFRFRWKLVGDRYARGVAAAIPIAKGRDSRDIHVSCLAPRAWVTIRPRL